MVILKPKTPGGAIIEVWEQRYNFRQVWIFAIASNKVRRRFVGSNYCDTKHSAICKARIRAKWLDDGTWDDHYTTDNQMHKPIGAYNNAMKRIEENDIHNGMMNLFQ
ncbi:MAG: hypothetical protein HF975_04225 [ANME-2 cluster archaeon]|nr:hypothetical protein [ANME-2 cluster archaeon]